MSETAKSLTGVRVLAALNGLELFGHERGNIEVFKALREQGAEVLVGVNCNTAGDKNCVADELRELKFETFPLPFGPQWSIQWVKSEPSIALTNFLAVLRCSRVFNRVIRQFRPTHIHLGSPLVYSYVSLALVFSKVPLIYRMGDCPPVNSFFNLQIWKMAMRQSMHVVANSEFVRNSTLAAGGSKVKISVLHNRAPRHTKNQSLECANNQVRDAHRLIYVGQISKHKGLLQLLDAFEALIDDCPDLCLDILGGSRYDEEFRHDLVEMISARGLEGKVALRGQIDDPTIYYQRAAIHVAPSMWDEPFANVVLEAKREGTPSVVFPSGGLPEMVRHGVDGYVCREKSVAALTEGLRWMLADRERLQQMGSAAKEDSEARFGQQQFQRAWADVYRSVSRLKNDI